MKAGFIISLFFYIPMIAFAIHDDASNIVIENLTEHVRLIPDKTGTALKEIKHSTQYTFRAKHSAGNAIATTYYDDDISIDKATGGDVSYKPFIINVFYSDSKICIVKASLPKKGATAKASFKRTFTKPEYFCRLSVGEKYHIERAVLKFEIPDCLAGRYTLKPQNMPDSMYSVEKVQEKDRLIVTYYLKGQKKLTPSSDSPPVSATIPQINLLGHFSDVDCLYRYLLSYIPADDPGTRYVADKAAEVTADCRDDNEKIKAVNDFVHANIRYLAVVHGESGQRPDPASEVLRKRFGDCKGSAILTRDMLRAVGIDARLVWIGTRDIGTDWTDIPNISSGNHMISAVMLPGDSIMFLDGTSTYSTPGNQPYGITGCQAMIEDTPDRCIIRRVPHTLPGHNLRDEHLTLTLDGNHLSAQGTVSLTGAFYRQARSAADDIIPGLRQEFYEHIFCNTMPGARPVEISCTVTADSMLVTGTATMPAAVKDAGVNSYVDTKIASRLDNIKIDTAGRTSGASIGFPSTIRCYVTVELPDGMTAAHLPPECSINNNWLTGCMTCSTTPDQRSINLTMTIAVTNPDIPFDMLKEYDADLSRFIKACGSNIVLKNSENIIEMQTMIKYRHCLRQLLILIIVTGIPTGARADIDRKFHDKAAQAVWSMDMPQFDPDTDLSDSIYSGKAAVYIARYRLLKATHDESLNNTKAMMTGIRNTNAINAVGIDRAMVKILDSSALDQFNSFEIPAPQKLDVYGLTMSSVTPTFGARITKPDGTVENIDIEEALTVTQGKNNSDASYKITIPGLEPGTVLDYFFYTEYFMDEISMPALKFIFMKEYPTKDFMLEMAVSSSLAMEYSHYNGAPDFSRKWTDGKYNCLSLHLSGMDAIETTMPFFSEARQVPCIEFRIINPTARMSSLRSTRGGGVRITAPYLLSDAASEIKNEKSPEKTLKDATSIMKKWKKNNPDASMREIVDAAFVALNFSCQKNQERHHQLQFCKSYSRLLENLSTKLPGRVAISSPRNAARIDDLASHSQAHYFVTVGDSCYFPSNSPLIAPGDIPEYFDSEKAYIYDGAPYRDNLHTAARSFTIPRSRPKDNTYETVSEVRLHLDSIWTMNVSTTFTANGTAKDMMNGTILPYEVQDEYARFLGQSPSKPLDRDQLLFLTTLQRKEMTERAKLMWDCDRVLLYNYEVKSIGCTPDRPVATFLLEGMLLDMTSTAGSDILVNIGKLIGHQYEVKGMQRKRDISVINPSAYQQRHTIRLEIPEGYEVVPQSVTALNRNISSPVATFFVEASIDNGYVVLRTIERHSAPVAPASAWPDILKVLDTAFEFNSATIALRRLGNNSESQSTTPN